MDQEEQLQLHVGQHQKQPEPPRVSQHSTRSHFVLTGNVSNPPSTACTSAASSQSQYVFKPILEPASSLEAPTRLASPAAAALAAQQQRPPSSSAVFLHTHGLGGSGGGGGGSPGRHTPAVTSSNSVDRGLLRMRISSGGGGGGPGHHQQQQQLSVASPVALRPTPKLYMCYRTNQEAWSSAGSRHSSRPGSSASSRPPSQCNNVGGGNSNNRSSNSSLSEVSVAKNLQSLSVSATREQRHAAFKTQKWSHSFDQGCGVASAQTSPGGAGAGVGGERRRRQPSLQQKSLDLDSGVGSLTSDLLKSSFSHGSQGSSSWSTEQHLGGVGSPVSSAREELLELKQEVESAAGATSSTTAHRANPSLTISVDDDDLSQGSSLPSFPDSFGRQRHLSSSNQSQHQRHLPVVESANDLSCLSGADEQLDEEIKMYMGASGEDGAAAVHEKEESVEQQPGQEGQDDEDKQLLSIPPTKKKDSCDSLLNGINEEVLSFLSKQCCTSDEPPPEIDVTDIIKQEEVNSRAAESLFDPASHVFRPEPKAAAVAAEVSYNVTCSSTAFAKTFTFSKPLSSALSQPPADRKKRLARSKTKDEEEKIPCDSQSALKLPGEEKKGNYDELVDLLGISYAFVCSSKYVC